MLSPPASAEEAYPLGPVYVDGPRIATFPHVPLASGGRTVEVPRCRHPEGFRYRESCATHCPPGSLAESIWFVCGCHGMKPQVCPTRRARPEFRPILRALHLCSLHKVARVTCVCGKNEAIIRALAIEKNRRFPPLAEARTLSRPPRFASRVSAWRSGQPLAEFRCPAGSGLMRSHVTGFTTLAGAERASNSTLPGICTTYGILTPPCMIVVESQTSLVPSSRPVHAVGGSIITATSSGQFFLYPFTSGIERGTGVLRRYRDGTNASTRASYHAEIVVGVWNGKGTRPVLGAAAGYRDVPDRDLAVWLYRAFCVTVQPYLSPVGPRGPEGVPLGAHGNNAELMVSATAAAVLYGTYSSARLSPLANASVRAFGGAVESLSRSILDGVGYSTLPDGVPPVFEVDSKQVWRQGDWCLGEEKNLPHWVGILVLELNQLGLGSGGFRAKWMSRAPGGSSDLELFLREPGKPVFAIIGLEFSPCEGSTARSAESTSYWVHDAMVRRGDSHQIRLPNSDGQLKPQSAFCLEARRDARGSDPREVALAALDLVLVAHAQGLGRNHALAPDVQEFPPSLAPLFTEPDLWMLDPLVWVVRDPPLRSQRPRHQRSSHYSSSLNRHSEGASTFLPPKLSQLPLTEVSPSYLRFFTDLMNRCTPSEEDFIRLEALRSSLSTPNRPLSVGAIPTGGRGARPDFNPFKKNPVDVREEGPGIHWPARGLAEKKSDRRLTWSSQQEGEPLIQVYETEAPASGSSGLAGVLNDALIPVSQPVRFLLGLYPFEVSPGRVNRPPISAQTPGPSWGVPLGKAWGGLQVPCGPSPEAVPLSLSQVYSLACEVALSPFRSWCVHYEAGRVCAVPPAIMRTPADLPACVRTVAFSFAETVISLSRTHLDPVAMAAITLMAAYGSIQSGAGGMKKMSALAHQVMARDAVRPFPFQGISLAGLVEVVRAPNRSNQSTSVTTTPLARRVPASERPFVAGSKWVTASGAYEAKRKLTSGRCAGVHCKRPLSDGANRILPFLCRTCGARGLSFTSGGSLMASRGRGGMIGGVLALSRSLGYDLTNDPDPVGAFEHLLRVAVLENKWGSFSGYLTAFPDGGRARPNDAPGIAACVASTVMAQILAVVSAREYVIDGLEENPDGSLLNSVSKSLAMDLGRGLMSFTAIDREQGTDRIHHHSLTDICATVPGPILPTGGSPGLRRKVEDFTFRFRSVPFDGTDFSKRLESAMTDWHFVSDLPLPEEEDLEDEKRSPQESLVLSLAKGTPPFDLLRCAGVFVGSTGAGKTSNLARMQEHCGHSPIMVLPATFHIGLSGEYVANCIGIAQSFPPGTPVVGMIFADAGRLARPDRKETDDPWGTCVRAHWMSPGVVEWRECTPSEALDLPTFATCYQAIKYAGRLDSRGMVKIPVIDEAHEITVQKALAIAKWSRRKIAFVLATATPDLSLTEIGGLPVLRIEMKGDPMEGVRYHIVSHTSMIPMEIQRLPFLAVYPTVNMADVKGAAYRQKLLSGAVPFPVPEGRDHVSLSAYIGAPLRADHGVRAVRSSKYASTGSVGAGVTILGVYYLEVVGLMLFFSAGKGTPSKLPYTNSGYLQVLGRIGRVGVQRDLYAVLTRSEFAPEVKYSFTGSSWQEVLDLAVEARALDVSPPIFDRRRDGFDSQMEVANTLRNEPGLIPTFLQVMGWSAHTLAYLIRCYDETVGFLGQSLMAFRSSLSHVVKPGELFSERQSFDQGFDPANLDEASGQQGARNRRLTPRAADDEGHPIARQILPSNRAFAMGVVISKGPFSAFGTYGEPLNLTLRARYVDILSPLEDLLHRLPSVVAIPKKVFVDGREARGPLDSDPLPVIPEASPLELERQILRPALALSTLVNEGVAMGSVANADALGSVVTNGIRCSYLTVCAFFWALLPLDPQDTPLVHTAREMLNTFTDAGAHLYEFEPSPICPIGLFVSKGDDQLMGAPPAATLAADALCSGCSGLMLNKVKTDTLRLTTAPPSYDTPPVEIFPGKFLGLSALTRINAQIITGVHGVVPVLENYVREEKGSVVVCPPGPFVTLKKGLAALRQGHPVAKQTWDLYGGVAEELTGMSWGEWDSLTSTPVPQRGMRSGAASAPASVPSSTTVRVILDPEVSMRLLPKFVGKKTGTSFIETIARKQIDLNLASLVRRPPGVAPRIPCTCLRPLPPCPHCLGHHCTPDRTLLCQDLAGVPAPDGGGGNPVPDGDFSVRYHPTGYFDLVSLDGSATHYVRLQGDFLESEIIRCENGVPVGRPGVVGESLFRRVGDFAVPFFGKGPTLAMNLDLAIVPGEGMGFDASVIRGLQGQLTIASVRRLTLSVSTRVLIQEGARPPPRPPVWALGPPGPPPVHLTDVHLIDHGQGLSEDALSFDGKRWSVHISLPGPLSPEARSHAIRVGETCYGALFTHSPLFSEAYGRRSSFSVGVAQRALTFSRVLGETEWEVFLNVVRPVTKYTFAEIDALADSEEIGELPGIARLLSRGQMLSKPEFSYRIRLADGSVEEKFTSSRCATGLERLLSDLGRFVGEYARSNRIPVFFRRQSPPSTKAFEALERALSVPVAVSDSLPILLASLPAASRGFAEEHLSRSAPEAFVSRRPGSHFSSGLSQLVRLTSPLRRWEDFFNLTQVERFVKGERLSEVKRGEAEELTASSHSTRDLARSSRQIAKDLSNPAHSAESRPALHQVVHVGRDRATLISGGHILTLVSKGSPGENSDLRTRSRVILFSRGQTADVGAPVYVVHRSVGGRSYYSVTPRKPPKESRAPWVRAWRWTRGGLSPTLVELPREELSARGFSRLGEVVEGWLVQRGAAGTLLWPGAVRRLEGVEYNLDWNSRFPGAFIESPMLPQWMSSPSSHTLWFPRDFTLEEPQREDDALVVEAKRVSTLLPGLSPARSSRLGFRPSLQYQRGRLLVPQPWFKDTDTALLSRSGFLLPPSAPVSQRTLDLRTLPLAELKEFLPAVAALARDPRELAMAFQALQAREPSLLDAELGELTRERPPIALASEMVIARSSQIRDDG